MWLVVVDTTQIQPYIFGSNRLRENIGASYLVDVATKDWAFQAVEKVAPGKNNIESGNKLIEDTQEDQRDNARIENGLDAEVLYAGGANFVVLFRDKDKARDFQTHLSWRALEEAPGLQLIIAQQDMEWDQHVLSNKLDDAFRTLAKQKRNRVWSAPLLGLSVTASCGSTGLPATDMVEGIGSDPGYLASDEIQAKVNAAWPADTSAANQRLQEVINLQEATGSVEYKYSYRFEDLGATAGEYSHIAVVHADGNGMGQRIRDIGDECTTVDKNREFVLKLRKFSIKVEDAAKGALNAVLGRLVKRIIDDEDGGKVIVHRLSQHLSIRIKLAHKDGDYFIPFRPIVFGGDDVTFVCDGRLGLALAAEYLQEFEQRTAGLGKNNGRLTACAGVAIVKNHYPFARAYALAVDLTRSAKDYRTELVSATSFGTKPVSIGSCLDWHFALSGLSSSIKQIRDREYETNNGSLTLRPVTLNANPLQRYRSWRVVWKGIKAFQKEEWAERRNKIKALRDALREGPEAVEHFRTAFINNRGPLPSVWSEMESWPLTGWQERRCGYFDAIELVDWFVPLEDPEIA